ncbi:MAG TPA: 50S ribosomal protein L6 [Acidimicrobiia bacterium]|nr:50S ribosomal protein L6 [Acidimicrobiia bacterium]
MSRIGKMPVPLPTGVTVAVDGRHITVKGPKGSLSRTIHSAVSVTVDDGTLSVSRSDEQRQSRAVHGLTRALVANMVKGVTDGFRRELQIAGVGYRAVLKGQNLELALGFSHSVPFPAPEGITFEVPEPTRVIVHGFDKELVGQVAANLRDLRPPEPYKGKGIRYSDERIRRKAGKAGKR